MIVDAEHIVDDAIVLHPQLVTQDRGAAELLHQRRGELLERVAQQNDLVLVAEALEELVGAFERAHLGEHVPQVTHRDTLPLEDFEPVFHQRVVVGFVPCRAREFVDTRPLGEVDPHLGNEHALDIEGHHLLRTHGR